MSPSRQGPRQQRVAILGIGALGCLFARHLHEVATVTLLGRWPAQVNYLADRPLVVVELDGRRSHHTLEVRTSSQGLPPQDLVLFLVKGFQTEHYAGWARQILEQNREATLVSLQNGLGHRAALERAVGTERVGYGVTYQAGYLEQPGLLHHTGAGKTWLPDSNPGRALAAVLAPTALEPVVSAEVEFKVWVKMSLNAAFNPLTAILGVPNGTLADDTELFDLAVSVGREVAAVANARGLPIDADRVADSLRAVALATATNYSSMVTDVRRGSETEVDSICGAVVVAAREAGIEAPHCAALMARLLPDRPQDLSPAASEIREHIERIEQRYREAPQMKHLATVESMRAARRATESET